jgi:hypothetical protein
MTPAVAAIFERVRLADLHRALHDEQQKVKPARRYIASLTMAIVAREALYRQSDIAEDRKRRP